jgi:hypothetical protein
LALLGLGLYAGAPHSRRRSRLPIPTTRLGAAAAVLSLAVLAAAGPQAADAAAAKTLIRKSQTIRGLTLGALRVERAHGSSTVFVKVRNASGAPAEVDDLGARVFWGEFEIFAAFDRRSPPQHLPVPIPAGMTTTAKIYFAGLGPGQVKMIVRWKRAGKREHPFVITFRSR